eukprot:scaffold81397_cov24-Cyclotella_meneghiniana.AAC.1
MGANLFLPHASPLRAPAPAPGSALRSISPERLHPPCRCEQSKPLANGQFFWAAGSGTKLGGEQSAPQNGNSNPPIFVIMALVSGSSCALARF